MGQNTDIADFQANTPGKDTLPAVRDLGQASLLQAGHDQSQGLATRQEVQPASADAQTPKANVSTETRAKSEPDSGPVAEIPGFPSGHQLLAQITGPRQELNAVLANSGIVPESDKPDEFKGLQPAEQQDLASKQRLAEARLTALTLKVTPDVSGTSNQITPSEISTLQNLSKQQLTDLDKVSSQNNNMFLDKDNVANDLIGKRLGTMTLTAKDVAGFGSLDIDDFVAKADAIANDTGNDTLDTSLSTNLQRLKGDISNLKSAGEAEQSTEQKIKTLEDKHPQLVLELRQDNTYSQAEGRLNLATTNLEHLKYDQGLLKKGDDFQADLDSIDKNITNTAARQEVYDAIEKIARSTQSPNNLINQQKTSLIEQLAHQIAHPEDIVQGNSGTCVLASIEVQLAKTDPGDYARLVSELAASGQSESKSGQVLLSIGPNTINDQYGRFNDDQNDQRSLASRLFQSATAGAIAVYMHGPGTLYYDAPAGWKDNDGQASPSDGMFMLADANKTKMPYDNTPESVAKLQSALTGKQYQVEKIDPSNPQAFLNNLEKSGFPASIGLTLMSTPYDFLNTGAGTPGGIVGGHMMTITGIKAVAADPKSNQQTGDYWVYYDNTEARDGKTENRVRLSELMDSLKQSEKDSPPDDPPDNDLIVPVANGAIVPTK